MQRINISKMLLRLDSGMKKQILILVLVTLVQGKKTTINKTKLVADENI